MMPPRDVSPAEAVALVSAGAVLVDVREPEEWGAGHAAVAFHLPMSQLVERADELPQDRMVVCVCRSGQRSAAVATALLDAGWDAVNLAGGMQAWALAGLDVVDDQGWPGTVA